MRRELVMSKLLPINVRSDFQLKAAMCSFPDDHIDKRRFPLFLARDVLQALVAELKAENAVAPE